MSSTIETVEPKKNQSENNPREMKLRGREIHDYHHSMSAIHTFRHIYPEAQLRYVVGPKDTLQSGGFPLKFMHRQVM